MSVLGKLARGVASGLGAYYGEVAKQDDDQRKADILAAREQALANLNHANRMTEISATGQENRVTHQAATLDDTAKELAVLPEKTKAQITAEKAKIAAQTQAEYDLLPAKTKATLTIEQYRQAQENARADADRKSRENIAGADRQARIDTNPTGTFEAADGTPVITYAPGATTRTTKIEGAHMHRSGSDDESYMGGIAPTAPAAPTSGGSALARDKARLGQIYPNATPDKYPGLFRNGQKIPLDEALQALEDDYRN